MSKATPTYDLQQAVLHSNILVAYWTPTKHSRLLTQSPLELNWLTRHLWFRQYLQSVEPYILKNLSRIAHLSSGLHYTNNMAETTFAILALLPVLAYFLYHQLQQYRYKRFAHIPSILEPNLFFGHLGYIAAGFQKHGNSKIHPGMVPL